MFSRFCRPNFSPDWWFLAHRLLPFNSSKSTKCFVLRCSPESSDECLLPLDWQVWQCGGSVEVLPCSRIAHIERAHKPYTENLTAHVRRNALRVAEVWMDQHKSHVYMAWNVPLQVRKRPEPGPCGCVRECVHSRALLLRSDSASQIS